MTTEINHLRTLDIGTATEEFFSTIVPMGGSACFQGPPGIAKSAKAEATARDIIREKGGVFVGWTNGSSFVQDNPPAGEPFKLAGDARAPKVIEGTPYMVYRHALMTGMSPLDFRGSAIPMDTVLSSEALMSGVSPEAISVFARSSLMMGVPDLCRYFVITIDDLKDRSLLSSLASMCHGGRLGDFELPGEFNSILSLKNRTSDRAGAVEYTMDVLDRMWSVNVSADREGHREWMRQQGFPAWATAFAQENIGASFVYDAPVPKSGQAYCSPRSYSELVKRLMSFRRSGRSVDPDHKAHGHIVQTHIINGIGPEVGPSLMDLMRLGPTLPKLSDIVDDPKGAKVPPRPDAQVFLTEVLSRQVHLGKINPDGTKTPSNFDEICTYVARIGDTPRALFVQSIAARHQKHNENRRLGIDGTDPQAIAMIVSQEPSWLRIYGSADKLREDHK